MKQEIKKEIEEYVLQEIQHLRKLDRQQEEYNDITTNSVKNITELVDLLQKEDININDLYLETRKLDTAEIKDNSEAEIKNKELDIKSKIDTEIRHDRFIKIGSEIAIVLVPTIFYNVWMKRGFEFEETGTFTSNTFKNLWGKFKLGK